MNAGLKLFKFLKTLEAIGRFHGKVDMRALKKSL